MKHYRDLTGDKEKLWFGDQMLNHQFEWQLIPSNCFGMTPSSLTPYRFRRPLTPSEITAEERKRFEAWCYSRCNKNNIRLAHGEYADLGVCLEWDAWCAAVGCDPMGDIQ